MDFVSKKLYRKDKIKVKDKDKIYNLLYLLLLLFILHQTRPMGIGRRFDTGLFYLETPLSQRNPQVSK